MAYGCKCGKIACQDAYSKMPPNYQAVVREYESMPSYGWGRITFHILTQTLEFAKKRSKVDFKDVLKVCNTIVDRDNKVERLYATDDQLGAFGQLLLSRWNMRFGKIAGDEKIQTLWGFKMFVKMTGLATADGPKSLYDMPNPHESKEEEAIKQMMFQNIEYANKHKLNKEQMSKLMRDSPLAQYMSKVSAGGTFIAPPMSLNTSDAEMAATVAQIGAAMGLPPKKNSNTKRSRRVKR